MLSNSTGIIAVIDEYRRAVCNVPHFVRYNFPLYKAFRKVCGQSVLCHRRKAIVKSTITLLLALIVVCAKSPLSAQTGLADYAKRSLPAVKLPNGVTPPQIDGKLDDSAWKQAAKAETFCDPQTSRPIADQTEAYVLYDKQGIYLAFHCHDLKPEQIVARETVRDADLRNDDHVQVEIDPFLTYKWEDYSAFFVNSIGTRRSRLGGGRAGKLEWQGDWQAAAQKVADGWTAEMRIPWGILSYPRADKPLRMGINFRRWQPRTQIMSLWSNLGPQMFNEREGIWHDVEVPAQVWRPRTSFLPYFMPSTRSSGGNSQAQIGLDARFQPTPELTAVATLNPDFASVEGAVESINFSRSERFVPDFRPFFLEGRNYLQLGQDYEMGAFFNPARIRQVDAGMKVYGKLTNNTTLGLLGTLAPGRQNHLVAQVRREIGPTSNVNFMALQRSAPGEDNTVLAVAPNVRWGKWSLSGQGALSLGRDAGGTAWTGAVDIQDTNFFGTLRYRRVAPNFLNRLGYIPFVDYQGLSGYFNWSTPWRKGFLRGFSADFFPTWDWHTDGRPFRRQAGFSLGVDTRSDYRMSVFTNGGKFDNDTDFTYGFRFASGVTNRFRQWGISLTTGQQANRPFTSYGVDFAFRLGKSFDLAYSSYLQSYQGFDQQHILTLNYQIDPFRSWGGRMVIQNSAVNFYLSYRNAGRRGMDTYIILGDPNAPSFVQRLMVKFVMAI